MKQFHCSQFTIYWTKNIYESTKTLQNQKWTGHPMKLSHAEQQYIYLLACQKPNMTWNGLVSNATPEISRSTIQHVMRQFNLKKWKSKQRIPLKRVDVKKQLKFARLWQNFTGWKDVIFSDECSVQRKPNNSTQFVFRFSSKAYWKDLVNLVNHGKDISQMIWGSIWLGGRSELVVMDRMNPHLEGDIQPNLI